MPGQLVSGGNLQPHGSLPFSGPVESRSAAVLHVWETSMPQDRYPGRRLPNKPLKVLPQIRCPLNASKYSVGYNNQWCKAMSVRQAAEYRVYQQFSYPP